MSTLGVPSATPPSLAEVLVNERQRGGVDVPPDLSLRELAKRAGVSAAQLSRIENGQVAKPRPALLVSVARALNRNPEPLLIVAGHMTGEEALTTLRNYFRDGAELPEVWGDWAALNLDDVGQVLSQSNPDDSLLRQIAADVFSVQETDETLWDDAYVIAAERGEDSAELRELMRIWRFIGGRRQMVLEYARQVREICDMEYKAEVEILSAGGDA